MTRPPPSGATASATTARPSRKANEQDAGAQQPPPCPEFDDQVIHEAGPPKKQYGVDGYLGRTLHLSREGEPDEHCLVVAWPAGKQNSDGKRVDVARHIDDAWFRLIENTLARIPWSHVKTLRRIVIDDHPLLHGLAAFDRGDPEDGRDGHTIWLNEHLFTDGDHWVRANVGSYFSYHTNRPNAVIDGQPVDHDLFSPVLLHEIGHIVMYNLVNPEGEEDRTPPCARTCGDEDTGCKALSKAEREHNCISPYCRPHGYPGSTENWAEQYRFYYQSSHTRALLLAAGSLCLGVLAGLDAWPPEARGWPFALPDPQQFRPSRWDSCGGHACKRW
jgi:hypothetical protein